MLTLHPSFDSSTFLTTYTFAVEPTHEFSLSVTVPHDALLAAELVAAPTSAVATAAADSAPSATQVRGRDLNRLATGFFPSMVVPPNRVRGGSTDKSHVR